MRKVEQVLVVGRDAALWLTALGLQRAFGRTGVEVQALELPSDLRPADVFSTTPVLQGLHRMLGLEETQVLAACAGAYTMAQRFSGWGGAAPGFLHAYDTIGARLNNVEFIHYWVKARAEGMKVALEDFSLGAAAAKAGRFVEHTEGTELFSKAAYGYRLHAMSYVALVKHHALRSGVGHLTGEPVHVPVEGQRISRVVLADGRHLEADLFVDASGSEAVLSGQMPDAAVRSWRQWLPCDTRLTATAQRLDPLPGFSEITALTAGWVGLYPLQDRTAVMAGFDSRETSDEEVVQAVRRTTGMRVQDVATRPFTPGVRLRPWSGNCVAIGAAAVSLEPLDATQLHLVHLGLSHLVSLFPTDADHPVGAGVYNETMAAVAASIRDFQIAHYKLNGRTGEPFWDRARAISLPAPLQYRLDLFSSRGVVCEFDNETFEVDDWLAILVGHGLIPRDHDPLVERTPADEQIQNFQRMLRFIAVEAKEMPSLQAHLELNLPSRSSAAF